MEIPVWSEMKSGVKIAVALAIVTLIISFSISVKVWYNGKINVAVKQATTSLQLDYAKEYIKLQDRSDEQEVKLKAEIDKIRKDNDENLKLLILSTTLFLLGLTACQSNPPAAPEAVVKYPAIPEIQKTDQKMLSVSFVDKMQVILQNMLPTPKKSD